MIAIAFIAGGLVTYPVSLLYRPEHGSIGGQLLEVLIALAAFLAYRYFRAGQPMSDE
jgi:hypothetical protein